MNDEKIEYFNYILNHINNNRPIYNYIPETIKDKILFYLFERPANLMIKKVIKMQIEDKFSTPGSIYNLVSISFDIMTFDAYFRNKKIEAIL